jgi:hypothetical protein
MSNRQNTIAFMRIYSQQHCAAELKGGICICQFGASLESIYEFRLDTIFFAS